MEAPIIYVSENGKIVEKEAPVVEHQCWWCKNPFMYEIRQPGIYEEEVVFYQCPSCEARESQSTKVFKAGKGERKE